MAWLVSVLGALLALAGGFSLWNGVSYIRLDWGQTETVAGTVALSAGIITLALGAVLFALRDLAGRQDVRPSGVGMEALTWSEEDAPVARPMMGRVKARLATVGLPRARNADAEPSPGPVDLDDRDEPDATDRRPPPVAPPPVAPMEAPAAAVPAAAQEAAYHAYEAGPDDRRIPPAEAPTVVGRYESNGASYVLFSDGTIEVETENGTHRFASMADLKAHIERQDPA